jgi:hypothetical protein
MDRGLSEKNKMAKIEMWLGRRKEEEGRRKKEEARRKKD